MTTNLPLGVVLSLLAALLYSSQTAIVKAQALNLPPLPVVIFIQSLLSLLLIMPFILKGGLSQASQLLTTKKLKLHLLRTVFSLSISYLLFYAITHIPLVNGLLLASTTPLIVPFIGYFFLSQKINHKLWIPILIGYSGVAIILHPDLSIFNPASLLALSAAIALASALLVIRKLSATEATETTAFYFFLISTIISGIISIYFWCPISSNMLLLMLVIGVLYFFCQYTSTAALKYANPQLVSSLFFVNIFYAAAIGQFIWNILPSVFTLFGMVLIMVGGILCIYVEHKTQLCEGHQRLPDMLVKEML